MLGASLLFAGTAVGAGMLALPAETATAGFVPSSGALLFCWAFTYATSLVTLEASWSVGRGGGTGGGDAGGDPLGAGFLSIARETLGPVGEAVTALLFWFLLTSIVVAYTAEGGQLISDAVTEVAGTSLWIPPVVGSGIFASIFAFLAIFGTSSVDLVNRVLVTGLIGSFLSLLGVGLPQISADLLSRGEWGAIYPAGISVGILSFGAQNVVPTLLQYLGGDAVRTRRAVLIGSIIPLAMYTLWEAVFLGTVPFDPSTAGSKMQVVAALGETGGDAVRRMVEIFSTCAIGSSMAGASVSLVDFFQDAIVTKTKGELLEKGPNLRRGVTFLALAPPVGLAYAYPDVFLGALENAGLLGGVSLYGVLPAISVIRLRASVQEDDASLGGTRSANVVDEKETMPGRLAGGALMLYALLALSATLVIPEFFRLGGQLLQ